MPVVIAPQIQFHNAGAPGARRGGAPRQAASPAYFAAPGEARTASTAPVDDLAFGRAIVQAASACHCFVFAIAAVLVFPALCFPLAPAWLGILASVAMLALAVMAWPLGAVLRGPLLRRVGPAWTLGGAQVLLAASTLGVALLSAGPGGASVPLLGLCHVGLGLSLGGLLERDSGDGDNGGGLAIGSPGLVLGLGLLAAAGLYALPWTQLAHADFLAWGWRYAFVAAFPIGVVGLFARLRLVGGAKGR